MLSVLPVNVADAPCDLRQLVTRGGRFVVAERAPSVLERAAPVHGAAQAHIERGDDGAHRGEQEHRGDDELDDADDVGDVRFHVRRIVAPAGLGLLLFGLGEQFGARLEHVVEAAPGDEQQVLAECGVDTQSELTETPAECYARIAAVYQKNG